MPTDRQLIAALRTIRLALDGEQCWYWRGRFYFALSDDWALAISPESAGRFRVEACYGLTSVASMWAFAWDRNRLVVLAQTARTEALALA